MGSSSEAHRDKAIAEFFEWATAILREVMPLIKAAVKKETEKARNQ